MRVEVSESLSRKCEVGVTDCAKHRTAATWFPQMGHTGHRKCILTSVSALTLETSSPRTHQAQAIFCRTPALRLFQRFVEASVGKVACSVYGLNVAYGESTLLNPSDYSTTTRACSRSCTCPLGLREDPAPTALHVACRGRRSNTNKS